MIITIHQPQYLPYIGFFHKLMLSDVCVILDDVEYSKNDFFNRNRIKTPQGWCWKTVPVKAKMKQLIKDDEIDNSQNWGVKHLKAILANYEKAAFFNEYQEFFKDYYSESWETLVDLNLKSIEYIAKKLNLNVKFRKSSELGINSKKTQRLVDICKKLNAMSYIAGVGSKDYMDAELFRESGIKLLYQDFKHPVYEQRFGKFEELMSVIDLIFNNGKKSIEIIKNSGGVFQ